MLYICHQMSLIMFHCSPFSHTGLMFMPDPLPYHPQSFTYRAKRPFLPSKLDDIMMHILDKSQAPFDFTANNIIRAKGFVWLANYPQVQGDFSLAGKHYSVVPGNPWWAEIDKTNWPENLERDIAPLWDETYGDRQQEIVIIGQNLNRDAITKALDECLVSEESMKKGGQEIWNTTVKELGDPFQDTWGPALAEAAGGGGGLHHDHEHHHAHGDFCAHGHGHEYHHHQNNAEEKKNDT